MPGTTDVTPLVLVIDRSAWGVRVLVSVALSLPGLGSVTPVGGATCAVLVRVPVAAGSMVPVSVMVIDCPVARLSPLQIPVAGSKLPALGVPKVGLRSAAGGAGDHAAAAAVGGRPGSRGDAGRQGVR